MPVPGPPLADPSASSPSLAMVVPGLALADPSASFGNVLAQTSAEAASLHGCESFLLLCRISLSLLLRQKAKTPMLAGAIAGSIMGAAYVVGFTIYFWKRCKRKKLHRRIKEGKAEPKVEPEPKEKIVIPPDPAVLLGHNRPGDIIVVDEGRHHRSKSVPKVHGEGSGSTSHLVRTQTERVSEDVSANV
ncbi:hypothetical protein DFH08DRAFT_202225 [Mycena albidolilacea]|uniref:Uncharacterized protein n=1 Tax=Mycena albidolilacea TaxID=1033008 RepID=A0AAD7EQB3_9AGAR|nr:hypothetical protein DFH08DRAFT_202225 [Mycena albidolilacea]